MPNPYLKGNGTTCVTCNGTGLVGERDAVMTTCPAGCHHGRIAFLPQTIVDAHLLDAQRATSTSTNLKEQTCPISNLNSTPR
jgi:hypothetical protein